MNKQCMHVIHESSFDIKDIYLHSYTRGRGKMKARDKKKININSLITGTFMRVTNSAPT